MKIRLKMFVALADSSVTSSALDMAVINLSARADNHGYVEDREWSKRCLGVKVPGSYRPGVGTDDELDFLKARNTQSGRVHVLVFPRRGSSMSELLGVSNRFVVYSCDKDRTPKSMHDLHDCHVFVDFEQARDAWARRLEH